MRKSSRKILVGLSLAALVASAACGGGGDGGRTPDSADGGSPAADAAGPTAEVRSPEADVPEADIGEGCVPQCDDRECGDDGCGGTCGACFDIDSRRALDFCTPEGRCCIPDCVGRDCGDDGCGGTCGSCFDRAGDADPELCIGGVCCVPDCRLRACGGDGCQGSCGACDQGRECGDDGLCLEPCEPECEGRCCGDDGCGGTCADNCAAGLGLCDLESCTCVLRYPLCEDALLMPPECTALEPAPTTPDAVADFVIENALPLDCTSSESEQRALEAFAERTGDARVIMFGEIHGTAELGHLSADLFETLVRAGKVDSFGIEAGIDMTGPINTYLETGGGRLVDEYGIDYFPPDLFITTLIHRARELHEEGFALYGFGVDSPMRLSFVNEELAALAAELPAEAADLLMEQMPERVELYEAPPADYETRAQAYREHVIANEAAICADADAALCERILQMAAAFWIGFEHQSDIDSMTEEDLWDFMSRREDLIYAAYRWNIAETGMRVYAHMGAAHTCTSADGEAYGGMNAGGLLQHDFAPTMGHVYSTDPAWGDGSSINYGGVIYDQPAEPELLARAMADAPGDEYAISLDEPGQGCITNPLEASLHQTYYYAPYSDCYDTMVYVRRLSPEHSYKASPHPIVKLLQARMSHRAPWRARR